MSGLYRNSVYVFALLSIALGVALLVETAVQGGGTVGFVLGTLFVGLGCGRLYLLRRR